MRYIASVLFALFAIAGQSGNIGRYVLPAAERDSILNEQLSIGNDTVIADGHTHIQTDTVISVEKDYDEDGDDLFDAIGNVLYYRLHLPFTYYRDVVDEFSPKLDIKSRVASFRLPQDAPHKPIQNATPKPVISNGRLVYKPEYKIGEDTKTFLAQQFMNLYATHTPLIRKWDYEIQNLVIHNPSVDQLTKPKVGLAAIFQPDPDILVPEPAITPVKLIKPSFWTHSGSGNLQISQLHVSDNWYKGGENNLNLQSGLTLKYNYNDRKHFNWDNTFEIKEGFNTSVADTVHNIRMNTDLFRYTGKVGLQSIIKNWYYSFQTQFSTQLFNAYNVNSTKRISALLSPSYLSVGIGMEYKKNSKKTNLSVNISALNYDMRFVADEGIDETRYGIEKGMFALRSYGSRITSTFEWRMTNYIKYNGRFEGFSNYERTEGSLENTLNFTINKYLSTSIFFHVRFDDNTDHKKYKSYFQFKDTFLFGLTYNWQ